MSEILESCWHFLKGLPLWLRLLLAIVLAACVVCDSLSRTITNKPIYQHAANHAAKMLCSAVPALSNCATWDPDSDRSVDRCAEAAQHWSVSETFKTRAAYEEHLARFANCTYASFARARIRTLDADTKTTAPDEAKTSPLERQKNVGRDSLGGPAQGIVVAPPPRDTKPPLPLQTQPVPQTRPTTQQRDMPRGGVNCLVPRAPPNPPARRTFASVTECYDNSGIPSD